MFIEKEKYNIFDLVEIMKLLRSDEGCDWDKEQNHHSIRMNLIEETYEVVEAIDTEDRDLLLEELGDLLLQVVFHAQIEQEQNSFNFDDVCDGICKKLVYRHPHVFGDVMVSNTGQVLDNWEKLKNQSKGHNNFTQTLESVPKTLPSLLRGEKVGKRAAKSGFDIPDLATAISSLKGEIAELEEAIDQGNDSMIQEEFGDVLFSCCNVGRFLKINSEKALTDSINKFIIRFSELEKKALKEGISLDNGDLQQMDMLWQEIKKNSTAKQLDS